jgi:hypothetical protein
VNLPPISFRAIAIAFAAELAADFVISLLVFRAFAGELVSAEMSEAEFEAVVSKVIATTAYVPWMMFFGTLTIVGGAWLAARIAKRIPYYHGLAMGIVGMLFTLLSWNAELLWPNILGLLVTIPASLYGAHLAKRQMPVEGG